MQGGRENPATTYRGNLSKVHTHMFYFRLYPAMNRRATVKCSSGTKDPGTLILTPIEITPRVLFCLKLSAPCYKNPMLCLGARPEASRKKTHEEGLVVQIQNFY